MYGVCLYCSDPLSHVLCKPQKKIIKIVETLEKNVEPQEKYAVTK